MSLLAPENVDGRKSLLELLKTPDYDFDGTTAVVTQVKS
jgi:hypothetical protein